MWMMVKALGYFALCAVLLVLVGIFYVLPIVTFNCVRRKLRHA